MAFLLKYRKCLLCCGFAACLVLLYDIRSTGHAYGTRDDDHVINNGGNNRPRDQGRWCMKYVTKDRTVAKSVERCRVLEFIENLNTLTGSGNCLDLSLLSNCYYVFYNAVPKSGSRLIRDLMEELAARYNYTTYKESDHMGMNPYKKGRKKLASLLQTSELNIPNYKRRHMFFVDFVRDVKTPRVMINVIREPIDHAVSIYNWLAFGDGVRNQTKGDQHLDLGDCLRKYQDNGICIKWRLLALPYFYGGQTHPTKEMLQVAKRRVEDTYLLVGLTEDISTFLQTLEILLPHLFCNVSAICNEIETQTKEIYQTAIKRDITDDTRAILRHYLSYNIDFYNFVKQRFYNIVHKLRTHPFCKSELFEQLAWNHYGTVGYTNKIT